MKLELTIRTDTDKITFDSLTDENGVYESRAHDLANVIRYDKETYGDVNIATIIRAAVLCGLIEETQKQ